MERINRSSDEKKLQIKAEIFKSTDHNLPKVPRSSGGSFKLALTKGSSIFSKSSLKNIVCLDGDDNSE